MAVLALIVAACQSAVTPSSATPGAPSSATTPATTGVPPITAAPSAGPSGGTSTDAVAAVRSFDGSTDAFSRLHAALDSGSGDGQALAQLLKDPDSTVRFAALYLVALQTDTPAEIDLLRGALSDTEPSLRVIAAGSLAGRGVADALPVLIDLLDADGQVPYSRPPIPLADHAWAVLNELTGAAFATKPEWAGWWTRVGSGLRWDGNRYVGG